MAETFKSFPVLPVSAWNSLRVQFKKSIPGSISPNYVATVLSISEDSARNNILPALRQINLVDKEGKTSQDVAKRLRDDALYPDLCRNILKRLYPQELIELFPDKDSDREKVRYWFMNHTGAGESATRKMTSFYLTLVEANPAISNNGNGRSKEVKTNGEKQKSVARKATTAFAAKNGGTESVANNHKEVAQSRQHSSPDLNINLQIHISSDASPDQIKCIFENMSKYLYNN